MRSKVIQPARLTDTSNVPAVGQIMTKLTATSCIEQCIKLNIYFTIKYFVIVPNDDFTD